MKAATTGELLEQASGSEHDAVAPKSRENSDCLMNACEDLQEKDSADLIAIESLDLFTKRSKKSPHKRVRRHVEGLHTSQMLAELQ